MSHGVEMIIRATEPVPRALVPLDRLLNGINKAVIFVSMLALVAAASILTYSVVTRYFLKSATDWQDEASVFLLVGATFMCGAYVQSFRGHIGIEAIASLLPKSLNRARLAFIDIATLVFCVFFSWKSWTLFHEAWAEGHTSSSSWAPSLAIPYGLMAAGMTLLSLQVLLQTITQSLRRDGAKASAAVVAAVILTTAFFIAVSPSVGSLTGVSQMSVLVVGLLFGTATLLLMFSGMPIAFALGGVAVMFMYFFMPASSLDTVTQNVYEEMASITLLSIPLFILKGAAIGKSRAGQDLYSALHVWMNKVPGGLGIANVLACALFAAMAGSSPATCSAIGSAGIPEMRKRGYSSGFAAGIIAAGGTLGILLPPSIVMILYAVAAEQSLGRLFLAGIGPGILLVVLFAAYAVFRFRKEHAQATSAFAESGTQSAYLDTTEYTLKQKVEMLPRVVPFVVLLIGVMVALYGGFATPSETAGLGAILALVLVGTVYSVWRPKDLAPILTSTLKESTMLMFIIGMSLLFSYVMSYLRISQSAAEWIVALHLSKWLLLAVVLSLVIVLGFFLPPVSIILMTVPILLPPLKAAGFDLVWFGILMTIVMEMGLIHPPVGLNIFVIKNVAPDISLKDLIWGVMPFVGLMFLAVFLICFFPGIATWFPDMVMGAGK